LRREARSHAVEVLEMSETPIKSSSCMHAALVKVSSAPKFKDYRLNQTLASSQVLFKRGEGISKGFLHRCGYFTNCNNNVQATMTMHRTLA
jgi:hypothetical protein